MRTMVGNTWEIWRKLEVEHLQRLLRDAFLSLVVLELMGSPWTVSRSSKPRAVFRVLCCQIWIVQGTVIAWWNLHLRRLFLLEAVRTSITMHRFIQRRRVGCQLQDLRSR